MLLKKTLKVVDFETRQTVYLRTELISQLILPNGKQSFTWTLKYRREDKLIGHWPTVNLINYIDVCKTCFTWLNCRWNILN